MIDSLCFLSPLVILRFETDGPHGNENKEGFYRPDQRLAEISGGKGMRRQRFDEDRINFRYN